jgi:hypothetical protein
MEKATRLPPLMGGGGIAEGEIELGGPPQKIRPEPVYFATATAERDMIANVVISYLPR